MSRAKLMASKFMAKISLNVESSFEEVLNQV